MQDALVGPRAPEDSLAKNAGPDPFGLVGTEINGRYQIDRLIGEGGMGAVYAAVHRLLAKPCAVKLIRPEVLMVAQLGGRERFLREARIGARGIPGIPAVYDVDEWDGPSGRVLFLAMELLVGRSLGDRLAEVERLDWREAFMVVARATQILEQAYALPERILHRDIKPDNIFLCDDGRVMVVDFGIAHIGSDRSESGLRTRTGALLGTPMFISPEQALAKEALDTRTDIYSLGATLYRAVSGCDVFPVDTTMAMLTRLMCELPIDVKVHVPELPEPVAAVIRTAMAKERRDRFATMGELRAAMEACLRAAPAMAMPPPRSAMLHRSMDGALDGGATAGAPGAAPGMDPSAIPSSMVPSPMVPSVPSAMIHSASTMIGTSAARPVVPSTRRRTWVLAALTVAVLALTGTAVVLLRGRAPSSSTPPASRDGTSAAKRVAPSVDPPRVATPSADRPAAAGTNAAGTNAAGTNAAGTNAAGTNAAGTNAAGSDASSAAIASPAGASKRSASGDTRKSGRRDRARSGGAKDDPTVEPIKDF